MFKKTLFIPLFLILLTLKVFATQMGDIAAGMAPGEWVDVAGMQNFSPSMLDDNNAGCCGILSDSEDAVWDPTGEQLFLLGASSGFSAGAVRGKFVTYKAESNQWAVLPKPSAFRGTHSYDHRAIDVKTQTMYHRPYGDRTVFKYDINSGNWTALPDFTSSVMGYNNVAAAIEYFPEMNSLLYCSVEAGEMGSLIRFDKTANAWVRVGKGRDPPMGSHNHFAEYNPVHQVVVFGGPNRDRIYKVDAADTITKIADAPFSIGNRAAVFSVDPVSGQYLAYKDGNNFYAYDVPTDSWHQVKGFIPMGTFEINGWPSFNTVATPVSNYGVVMYVKKVGSTAKLYLYKHSPLGTTAVQVPEPVSPGGDIRISPNPFRDSVTLEFTSMDFLRILNVQGKMISEFPVKGKTRLTWVPENRVPGIYFAQLKNGGRTETRRITMVR